MSIPAFAAKNSQNLNIPEKLTVGATSLPAGDYNVTWTGTGPTVQVSFVQKNVKHPATATVAAKLVEQKNNTNGITLSSKSGVDALQTVLLKNVTLVLGDAPAPGQ